MNIDNPLDKPEAEGGTEAGAAVGEEEERRRRPQVMGAKRQEKSSP